MTNTKLHGIKNCDTMKKAFKWLEDHNIAYEFHNYKKLGAEEAVLNAAINAHGWEAVINRRGTTWRKLEDAVKESMDAAGAVQIALENPSIIKRPLLTHEDEIHLGFSADIYKEVFKV